MIVAPIEFPCRYIGDASRMHEVDWLQMNAILLRSRWRDLMDMAIESGEPVGDENDYWMFCASQFDLAKLGIVKIT